MRTVLIERLKSLKNPHVLVIGDLILDRYVKGEVNRVSPEAPIQILNVKREEERLGGAANVAHNLSTLITNVDIVGVVGADQEGKALLSLFEKVGIIAEGVFEDSERVTTVKTRMIAHNQQLLRIDREIVFPVNPTLQEKMINWVKPRISQWDVIVFSDYAKGLISSEFTRLVISMAREKGVPVFVGPKGKDWLHYEGATCISANRTEMENISGLVLKNEDDYRIAAQGIMSLLKLEAVVLTLGSEGMFLLQKNGKARLIHSVAREVYDVTGAGDTVLAALAFAISSGYTWEESINIANTAAGITVGKVGVVAVTREELYIALSESHISLHSKLKTLPELLAVLKTERGFGKNVCFTNGCFDILHPGHIRFLSYCKEQCDLVVVGLNSDSSVHELKGGDRPILKQAERAEMLGAISFVDYIVLFDDPTPWRLINEIRPDVLVKGSDWAEKGVVGRDIVESYGGRVELYPINDGYSTTSLIKKIRG